MSTEANEPLKTHDVGCACGDCIVWYGKNIGDGRCPWCKRPLDIHKDAIACQPEGAR